MTPQPHLLKKWSHLFNLFLFKNDCQVPVKQWEMCMFLHHTASEETFATSLLLFKTKTVLGCSVILSLIVPLMSFLILGVFADQSSLFLPTGKSWMRWNLASLVDICRHSWPSRGPSTLLHLENSSKCSADEEALIKRHVCDSQTGLHGPLRGLIEASE